MGRDRICQPPKNARHVPNWWLREAFFPIQHGEGAYPKIRSGEPLGESQLPSPLPKMLAKGLGLKVRFLWFPCLKSNCTNCKRATRPCIHGHFGNWDSNGKFND